MGKKLGQNEKQPHRNGTARWIGKSVPEKLQRARAGLAVLAVAWFALAAVELTLHALISRSAFHSHDLPVGARLLLFCHSLTVLTAFLLLAGAATAATISICRLLIRNVLGARLTARAFLILPLWLLLILYGASWGLFWQTGSYIGSAAVAFMLPHPLQVFHWVDFDVAFTIVALAGVAAFAGVILLPRWIAQQSAASQQKLFSFWKWAVGFSMIGAVLGFYYSRGDERQSARASIIYSRNQENKSGPFSFVLADFTRRLRNSPGELSLDRNFEILQRPIISLEQYASLAEESKRKQWNVLLLSIESLRADQLRAYGSEREIMPNLEALASAGRVFLNTYTQASHTNYATITPLSSHYPLRSATEHAYPENPTYPRVLIYDVLKALGYRTAIFSSSNEYWGGMINYLETGHLDRFVHAANSKRPAYVMQGDTGFASWARQTKHAGSLDDSSTVDEAIEWIDSLAGENFFVAMNFQNSHLPYPVPPSFPRRFGPEKLDFTIRFAHFPKDKVHLVKAVYANSLAYVDFQIGRLFEYLKATNKWEDTVIVVTGDHGQAFYEHGFASHASEIYDEVMKVPLLFRAPGLKPGSETRLAQHVDIAPSILGLLGLPVHPSFQGIDLFHTVADPNRSAYLVAQTPEAYQYGIVRGRYKLLYDERQRDYLLFNIAADPGEKNNLAAAEPVVVKQLARRLDTWRSLQISYYADPEIQKREYPPILRD
ncbi:MAG TPA: sulfatase [Candidatus Binatia bacterium]|nr:sulfatase [Candidatus Binatia bacterium]